MATFNKILLQQADYCQNSGITVSINSPHDWVEIKDAQGGEIFLQGEDARQFISEVEALENKYPDENRQNILLVVAYPYADMLSEA